MLIFCTKLHSHTYQKYPAIESEWGRMKVRVATRCSGACCACKHKGLGPMHVTAHFQHRILLNIHQSSGGRSSYVAQLAGFYC